MLSLLPSLQYGVGSDYFSYERIFNNTNILEYYYRNNEIAFYYLVKVIHYFNSDSRFFFIFVSILQSCLIISSFNILKRHGYNLVIIFFLFFTVTNLLHTQMNIIRASFSIYLFVLALLYRLENKNLNFIFLIIIATLFHKSAFVVAPMLLIPMKWYTWFYKHALVIYISTFLIYFFNPFTIISTYIIDTFFSYYSLYLTEGNFTKVSIVNLFTKLYYLPIIIYFFSIIKGISITEYSKRLIGLWVITANMFILVYHFDFFSRINYFFVYFYIIPLYYSLKSAFSRKKYLIVLAMIIYILTPYVLKVVAFPIAEFKYNTFLF
ncbi:EpsG family protein [Providencia sp. PAZ2]|uniref:EpsG family protein n=1 Tax=Providencia lanzhouensis TaxID=3378099 RepID=UPI003D2D8E07